MPARCRVRSSTRGWPSWHSARRAKILRACDRATRHGSRPRNKESAWSRRLSGLRPGTRPKPRPGLWQTHADSLGSELHGSVELNAPSAGRTRHFTEIGTGDVGVGIAPAHEVEWVG